MKKEFNSSHPHETMKKTLKEIDDNLKKESNLSDEECYDAIGGFYYWKEESIKEFIKGLKDYKLKCALWGNAWIDDDEIIKENIEKDISAPIKWKGKIIEFKPQKELDKLAGDKFK